MIAFLWGLGEATCFFIVPDVYLSYLALSNYRRAMIACLWSVAGAVLGGACMVAYGAADHAGAVAFLETIPGISMPLITQAGLLLNEGMLQGMLEGAIAGIPYKIFAVQAGVAGLPVAMFLLCTIPARLLRFAVVVSFTALLCQVLLKGHSHKIRVCVHALLWVAFYAFYFHAMRALPVE